MGGEGVWFVPTGEICAWQYLSSGWSTGPGNGCRCTGLGIGQINGLGVGIARCDPGLLFGTCAALCLAFASCFRCCGSHYQASTSSSCAGFRFLLSAAFCWQLVFLVISGAVFLGALAIIGPTAETLPFPV